jgi:protein SCO1
MTPSAGHPLRRGLLAAALLAGLLALGLLAVLRTQGQAGLPPGGDFTLRSADGPVALHDFRGKAVLVFFGFTNCEGACPAALSCEAAALRLLPPGDQAKVAGLLVSVDPDRDTLPALKEYGHAFHPQILGVTGPDSDLQAIARRYGALYRRQEPDRSGNYSVDHTTEVYLVAPDGRLAARMPQGTTPEAMAAEIRLALR